MAARPYVAWIIYNGSKKNANHTITSGKAKCENKRAELRPSADVMKINEFKSNICILAKKLSDLEDYSIIRISFFI